jgi:hypothetical protein
MATRRAAIIMIIQTQWPIRRGFGGRVLISGTMPASLTLRGQVVAVNLVPKFGCPAARLAVRRQNPRTWAGWLRPCFSGSAPEIR